MDTEKANSFSLSIFKFSSFQLELFQWLKSAKERVVYFLSISKLGILDNFFL